MRSPMHSPLSRRRFLELGAAAAAVSGLRGPAFGQAAPPSGRPLDEVDYADVTVHSAPHLAQVRNTQDILRGISNDSLLKPFREMAGQQAPGVELGGWYEYKPDYQYMKDDAGFAPGSTFGQWVSAMCRHYAVTRDPALRARVLELNRLYAATITPVFYDKNRFPAYCFDKLVCGLMDSHRLAGDPEAFSVLNATTDAARNQLPGHAVDRETAWRPGRDISWTWDESYTIPENLYLVYSMGAGQRYIEMARQYLDDATYFDPLARGENVLGHRQAYSYVNALCSAMQAYMVGGSGKHFLAARNGFDMVEQQSFATGGWGPDEMLRKPGSGEVAASLTKSHNNFETPCGSYAHFKLTRYLLRVTREGRYGDSMERVMYNAALGALPMRADGQAFFYADYNFKGKRVYSKHLWPCCSGTLPQVAADYGINSYLREPGAVWVNLYIPSTLRWRQGSAHMELEQRGEYPYSDTVELRVRASAATPFTLRLRIPAWSQGARITVNGRAVPVRVAAGFASIERTWKTGDRVQLELPAQLRLQAIDAAHPQVAALMYGPLVLFAKTAAQPPISREAALSARRTGRAEWAIDTPGGALRLAPFPELGEVEYTTYLQLT